MNPFWAIACILLLLITIVAGTGAFLGFAKRAIPRNARRIALERRDDSAHGFADAMRGAGVSPEVSSPLYSDLSWTFELYGIYSFPPRPDDDLRAIYGFGLPDEYNEFMDLDLRDVANRVARRCGRRPNARAADLDRQLSQLATVRDLGRWTESLPRVGELAED